MPPQGLEPRISTCLHLEVGRLVSSRRQRRHSTLMIELLLERSSSARWRVIQLHHEGNYTYNFLGFFDYLYFSAKN